MKWQEMYEKALKSFPWIEQKSPEFKMGIMQAMRLRINKKPVDPLYPEGTCQMDAFRAGIEQEMHMWREAMKIE